jgi:hypothetical protein
MGRVFARRHVRLLLGAVARASPHGLTQTRGGFATRGGTCRNEPGPEKASGPGVRGFDLD